MVKNERKITIQGETNPKKQHVFFRPLLLHLGHACFHNKKKTQAFHKSILWTGESKIYLLYYQIIFGEKPPK